jgi:predicted CXXCH cytochrome family protein
MALGMVRNRTTPIPMLKGNTVMPSGKSRFGTDLSAHHPISFVYDSGLATVQRELRDPAVLSKEVKLDHDRQMQCTSCHDPHSDRFGKFLVKDNTASALCLECHVPKDWKNSSHAISAATWKGTGRNPWPNTKFQNVAANGCENCHTPHNAGTKPHLLHYSKPEDNCLVCHNGSVAEKNLLAEFNKVSTHPITGVTSTKDFSAGMMRGMDSNVSCTDCHNPHASGNAAAKSGTLDPALSRVKGMNAGGALVDVSSFEYELCFRCHASSTSVGTRMLPRQFSQPNVRLQFTPGNRSYHPVLAPARAVNDPTLITPWTEAQTLKCSDCHNNDQGPGAKANGPNGPHGSRYAPLLERNLVQVDGQAESPTAYALCYKCHSESILMADRLHGQHVREQKTACTTCHDSHGVQNQTHLINFNTLYARPLNGQLSYTDLGAGLSQCTLTCHGKDHQGSGYNTSQPVRAATARRR